MCWRAVTGELSEHGYAHTSVERVAGRADIIKTAIYLSSDLRALASTVVAALARPCPCAEPSTPGTTSRATQSSAALSKLRQFDAVATRYDERERIYQNTLGVASIRLLSHDRDARSGARRNKRVAA